MSDSKPILLMKLFIRDLLGYDEQLIKTGRDNVLMGNDNTSYIAVDALGNGTRLARSKKFDGDNEVLGRSQLWAQPIVVSCYGDNAYINALDIIGLCDFQESTNIQELLDITVFVPSSYIDTKLFVGNISNNRVDVNINLQYNNATHLSTLRFDTLEHTIITNN